MQEGGAPPPAQAPDWIHLLEDDVEKWKHWYKKRQQLNEEHESLEYNVFFFGGKTIHNEHIVS